MELQRKVESIQNYGMRLILSKPARTPSIDLRKELNWVPLVRRRDMFQLFLVHRCVTRRAPRSLSESLRTNGDIGNRRTRGWNNLFLPLVSSELFRRSFTFKGSQDWNSLPRDLKAMRSSSAFRASLTCYFKQRYFMDIS